MKYAKEVIELLSAYPKKPFKMRQLVNTINPHAKGNEYETIRKGISRVLEQLSDSGHIKIQSIKHQTSKTYTWK